VTRRFAAPLVAVALLALAAPGASAHRFHASLAELEYVPTTHTVEISIRVFPDDLEEALGRRTGKHVRLDVTPNAEQLAEQYVRSAFVLYDSSKKEIPLEWVGMEVKTDSAWLFVQATVPDGLDGVRLRNAIFFELFGDQVNTVNVKRGGAKSTLVFKSGDPARPVE
jgi:hypothetical protein